MLQLTKSQIRGKPLTAWAHPQVSVIEPWTTASPLSQHRERDRENAKIVHHDIDRGAAHLENPRSLFRAKHELVEEPVMLQDSTDSAIGNCHDDSRGAELFAIVGKNRRKPEKIAEMIIVPQDKHGFLHGKTNFRPAFIME
jgi:hypothetical protein